MFYVETSRYMRTEHSLECMISQTIHISSEENITTTKNTIFLTTIIDLGLLNYEITFVMVRRALMDGREMYSMI